MGLVTLGALLAAADATARPHRRPFEPTDLDLEDPGTIELDAQVGYVLGPVAARWVAPDFELDVGLARNVELDLDGALAFEGTADRPYTLDHATWDNLWVALKFGLGGEKDLDEGTTYSFGVQLGPKLGLAPGASGVGIEGLLLFRHAWNHVTLVVNGGGFVEPEQGGARPTGVQGGVDLEVALDARDRWAILGAVGGAAFASDDPGQVTVSTGGQWKAREALSLSLVVLRGFLDGADRWALLLGMTANVDLF